MFLKPSRIVRTGLFILAFVLAACSTTVVGPKQVPSIVVTLPPTSALPETGPTPTLSTPIPPFTGTAVVIDPESAPHLTPVPGLTATGASQLAYAAGHQTLALATDTEVVVYSLNPPATLAQVQADHPSQLVTAPDQSRLAYATADNQVHVWSIPDNRELQAMTGITATVTSLAFSPDSSRLAASTYNGAVWIWEAGSGQLLKTWNPAFWLSNLSFSPDSNLLAGVDQANFTVHIFDIESGQEQRQLAWTGSASPALYGAFFSPDWKQIAWVARGTVQLMDASTGGLGPIISHEDFVNALAWSPDGSLLATAAAGTVNGAFTPIVYIWDAATGELVKSLPQPDPVLTISFSPDGKQLAALNSKGAMSVWSANPEK